MKNSISLLQKGTEPP